MGRRGGGRRPGWPRHDRRAAARRDGGGRARTARHRRGHHPRVDGEAHCPAGRHPRPGGEAPRIRSSRPVRHRLAARRGWTADPLHGARDRRGAHRRPRSCLRHGASGRWSGAPSARRGGCVGSSGALGRGDRAPVPCAGGRPARRRRPTSTRAPPARAWPRRSRPARSSSAPPPSTSENCGRGWRSRLAGGDLVRADHVVIATLGPIHDPALLSTRCEARRSYAIAAPSADPLAGTYISVDADPVSLRPAMRRRSPWAGGRWGGPRGGRAGPTLVRRPLGRPRALGHGPPRDRAGHPPLGRARPAPLRPRALHRAGGSRRPTAMGDHRLPEVGDLHLLHGRRPVARRARGQVSTVGIAVRPAPPGPEPHDQAPRGRSSGGTPSGGRPPDRPEARGSEASTLHPPRLRPRLRRCRGVMGLPLPRVARTTSTAP